MSVLIPIRLSSIKKNPDYGLHTLVMEGKKNCEIVSDTRFPSRIEKDLHLVGATIIGEEYKDCLYQPKGDPALILPKIQRFDKKSGNKSTVTLSHNPRFIDNSHAPKYYYKYKGNTIVHCDDCHAPVRFKDIRTVSVPYDEYDEINADQCPVCEEINTFHYKIERIEDALKRKNPVPE